MRFFTEVDEDAEVIYLTLSDTIGDMKVRVELSNHQAEKLAQELLFLVEVIEKSSGDVK